MVRNLAALSFEKGGSFAFRMTCKKVKMYPNYLKKQKQLLCESTSWAKPYFIDELLARRVAWVDRNSMLGELGGRLGQTAFKNILCQDESVSPGSVLFSWATDSWASELPAACLNLAYLSSSSKTNNRAFADLPALQDHGFLLGSGLAHLWVQDSLFFSLAVSVVFSFKTWLPVYKCVRLLSWQDWRHLGGEMEADNLISQTPCIKEASYTTDWKHGRGFSHARSQQTAVFF